jgi:hypothetical protein
MDKIEWNSIDFGEWETFEWEEFEIVLENFFIEWNNEVFEWGDITNMTL